jgi:hypothetical protein
VRIPGRFNGPPDSAHGGVACGVFAGALDSRQATVRLTAPPPLDTEFEAVDADGWRVVVGPDGPVGRARQWNVPEGLDALPLVDAGHIEQGRAWWRDNVVGTHAFPTCFGCGHERPSQDGLFLHAGFVEGSEYYADTWTPAQGETDDWWIWAAVDCPSGFAAMATGEMSSGRGPIMLGELSLSISESPDLGVEYQVVARPAGHDGRKLRSDVALVAPDGENIARGRSTWIRLA